MPGLRVIQSMSAGVDWLLPRAPKGVTVCRAVGVHDRPVSEWVIAAILAMQRGFPEYMESQRLGRWNRDAIRSMASEDLDGQTVVVLGYGSIGRTLASRLTAFGVHVIGVARHPREDARPTSALPELLPGADVVVDLLPLTPATERFVDAAFLNQMKSGALLVNAGRGKTVDTSALLDALRSGRVRAALDVTDPEPLPDGHPLWHAPNVLITPHIAGSTSRWIARAYRFAGEQIRRYAAGEPLLGVET
ncbi:MAG TPA: 2-hydroxyacid dehydrogenase [Candidatus Limnocylindrales bacterium]|nr:2-hydroxyacid dehydrogenase [Candidatus Limnocylindrales bacterium]